MNFCSLKEIEGMRGGGRTINVPRKATSPQETRLRLKILRSKKRKTFAMSSEHSVEGGKVRHT